MGHANVSNLSELFVRLLYAKGKLTVADAVATAQRRGETVHASEGEYDDEAMLSFAFSQIVEHLNCDDGAGFDGWTPPWPGPWIEPDWNFSVRPKGGVETPDVTDLLKQCCEARLNRAFGDVTADAPLFGVCADAIQDTGQDEWADRVREFPRRFFVYRKWKLKEWDVFDDAANGAAFDRIPWRFLTAWRKRFRAVPRLAQATN